MIYADHASTSPLCRAAKKALTQLLFEGLGNPLSLHALGRKAACYLEEARHTIAQILGAKAKEIYFTSGGSEGNNQALFSAAALAAAKGQNHIIAFAFEHSSVLSPLHQLVKQGFSLTLLNPSSQGFAHIDQVENALQKNTGLVTLMAVNNETGALQPVEALGQLCKEKNIMFHCDAVQALGHLPINVKAIGADYLTFSGHKFGGPTGIGAIYAKRPSALSPILLGGGTQREKRGGTPNTLGAFAMAQALISRTENSNHHNQHLWALRQQLLNALEGEKEITLYSPSNLVHPGIICLGFNRHLGEEMVLKLDLMDICVSAGAACSAGKKTASHVLTAMGFGEDRAQRAIRISFGPQNTLKEATLIAAAIKEILHRP